MYANVSLFASVDINKYARQYSTVTEAERLSAF
jgi:hypothetical protein